ncbi:MAG: phosphotransferase, partial [Pseudomonadota bacterium]|nr:phosphotransferase [Pseudomonadota bacterium]
MMHRFDRQAAFAGTRAADLAHEIDPLPLGRYLARSIEGFAGPVVIEQFKGGQSNPTYLVRAKSETYVLRRKPAGPLLKSAHAVEREYRVTRALHRAGFPVPAPLALCTDDT